MRSTVVVMIRIRGLTKDFARGDRTVHAVRGLDLDIAPGELVAVLGPNGAGKSTTMRMLTTLIAPSAGSAEVGGHDVITEAAAVRRTIGYVGQGNGAGHNQRVRDELRTQGAVFGLDPQNRANLWSHVLRMRAEHAMTVVLTTHYMDEADAMAERVVVVDHGRIIADDTADRLKADLAGDRVVVTSSAPGRLAELARRLSAQDVGGGVAACAKVPPAEARGAIVGTAARPGGPAVTIDGARVEVRVADGPRALPVLLAAAQAEGVPVETAQVHRPTLDDVFLTLTGRSLREAATSERSAA